MIGTTISHYRIVGSIGAGSFLRRRSAGGVRADACWTIPAAISFRSRSWCDG